MSHEFRLQKEIALEATPEQVWEAIATGPGIDSWFLGSTTVEPGVGGAVTVAMGEFSSVGQITVWEPLKQFAYRGGDGPDGSFMAMEYLIEARGSGSTVLRMVQSGMLGGDWEAEYEALNKGWDLYLQTLSEYIQYFPGLRSISVGGQAMAADQPAAWEATVNGLGLPSTVAAGDQVKVNVPGLPPIEGVVDFAAAPDMLGVRTDDALYRFSGRGGGMGIGHHLFSDKVPREEAEQAWQKWLNRAFA